MTTPRNPMAPEATPGRRSTCQLEATYGALCRSLEHPTADQLLRLARELVPTLSRATVYRNLQKLVEDGRVRVVAWEGRSARYDARLDSHDHFICRSCDRVLDVKQAKPRAETHPSRVAGHRVDGRSVTYFGFCQECEGLAPGDVGVVGD